MKILLVVATKQEVIESKFKDCTVLVIGVGMVNTAIHLTEELLKNEHDVVLNMGVAGSFSEDFKIGDVIEVVEDNFSEIGFENGSGFEGFSDFEIVTNYSIAGKTDLQKVRGITVNTVHGNEKSINEIVKRFNPDVESMEGAAVFKVCKKFAVTCMQIRAISNKVEKRNKENWDMHLAIKNLNDKVAQIITDL